MAPVGYCAQMGSIVQNSCCCTYSTTWKVVPIPQPIPPLPDLRLGSHSDFVCGTVVELTNWIDP